MGKLIRVPFRERREFDEEMKEEDRKIRHHWQVRLANELIDLVLGDLCLNNKEKEESMIGAFQYLELVFKGEIDRNRKNK